MSEIDLYKKAVGAIYRKDYELLDSLLTDENINWTDRYGDTLLSHAVGADNSDPEMINYLLDKGAGVNRPSGSDQLTPLHIASRLLKRDLILILLQAGGDVNQPDKHGNYPLTHAIMASDPRVFVVTLLVRHGADPERKVEGGQSPKEFAESAGQKKFIPIMKHV